MLLANEPRPYEDAIFQLGAWVAWQRLSRTDLELVPSVVLNELEVGMVSELVQTIAGCVFNVVTQCRMWLPHGGTRANEQEIEEEVALVLLQAVVGGGWVVVWWCKICVFCVFAVTQTVG